MRLIDILILLLEKQINILRIVLNFILRGKKGQRQITGTE